MLNYLPTAIVTFDDKYICQDNNLLASQLFEKTSELVGLSLETILRLRFNDDDVKLILEKLGFDPSQPLTFPGVTINTGENRYFDLTFNHISRSGDVNEVVLTIVEVTQHILETNKLKTNMLLLEGILENTSNIIYAKDLEGKIMLINRQFEKVFNVSKERILGIEGCCDYFPEEIAKKVRENDQEVIKNGVVTIFEEDVLIGNRIHTYLSTKFPLKDQEGNVFGLGGVSTEISELRRRERFHHALKLISNAINSLSNPFEIMEKVVEEAALALEADTTTIAIIDGERWTFPLKKGHQMEEDLIANLPYEDLPISCQVYETGETLIINDFQKDSTSQCEFVNKLDLQSCIVVPFVNCDKIIGTISYGYCEKKEFSSIEIDFVNQVKASLTLALDNVQFRDNLENIIITRTRELEDVNAELAAVNSLLAEVNSKLIEEIKVRERAEKDLRESEERFSKAFYNNPVLMAMVDLETGQYLEANDCFLKVSGYQLKEVLGKASTELKIISIEDRDRFLSAIRRGDEVKNQEITFYNKAQQKGVGLISMSLLEVRGRNCLLLVIRDITETKRLQRELTRLDQLNLVGEMAAGIGHEIRNPMTTARGFLQIMGEKSDCSNYKEYFDLIIEELDRANAIITEFLTMAKNKKVEIRQVNLNRTIKALSSLIKADAIIYDKGIKLELGDIPVIFVDEQELRQLILNLVRNGLEAMESGGLLTLKTYVQEQQVVLEVKDEGCGIPPGLLEKLGTPFVTTKDHGTGLGLAVCYSIAARHKAQISLKTSSKGTSFFVKFNTGIGEIQPKYIDTNLVPEV